MKILSIEKELKTVDWKNESPILIEEVKSAYKLILPGTLTETYFSEKKHTVLIPECEDKIPAKELHPRKHILWSWRFPSYAVTGTK